MTQYAGQMLPAGDPRAVSRYWAPADGKFHPHYRAHDYFRRLGFRPGAIGIWHLRTPAASPGWLVLLRDDPTQPDLPPETPDAGNPPTALPAVITIATIADQQAGSCAVSGTVTPAGTAVQGAFNNGTNVGSFVALTTTGTTFAGLVTVPVGATMRVRVRQTALPPVFVDSNQFQSSLLT